MKKISIKLYNGSVSSMTWTMGTSYDGNPARINFADGSYTENIYSSAGEKLKMTHSTSVNGIVAGKTSTE